MSEEDWVSPSDDDQAAVSRLALHAAMKELDGIVFHGERDSADAVRQVLKATNAIKQILRKAEADFKARNPGKKCHGFYGVTALQIVASAYWACGNEFDVSEVDPTCVAGQAILDFAAAIALLNAANAATTILSEGSEGLFGERDAALFLGDASSS